MSYLRPCFYKLLPESERPSSWERFAEEDEIQFAEQQKAKQLKKDQQPPTGQAEAIAVPVAAPMQEGKDDTVEATEVEAMVE